MELVMSALAPEMEFFTMDEMNSLGCELLGELDMPDFEADARIRNEHDSDRINYYGNLDAERRGVIDLGPQGLPEAMTVDNDRPLWTLARTQVDLHRAVGSEAVTVFDLHQDYATNADMLPPWDISDPNTASVQRGLIAGKPDELYVIRGRFTARDLLVTVWSQYRVRTQCGMRISVDCDLLAKPCRFDQGDYPSQKVYGVFTVPIGEYLVYFTTCASCYASFWHQDGEHTDFDVFDPAADSPIP
ncbi:hypothetical protein [Mycolicibacterium sp.]|uniref:hypothetical protein n=1 Tax=Mycolicibacterium sp. TaxID=2320850 RepID=UPI00355E84A2